MQRKVIILMLICAVERVLSCEPCKCAVDDTGYWPGLQVAKCENVQGLSSVPDTDTLPDYIQVLYIYIGSITTIKENQFVPFKKLRAIKINNSNVSKVESHAFRNMTNVTEINLSYNLITELPAGLFSDTPGLVQLWLRVNKLKILPKQFLSNLKYLKIVSLSDNPITSIETNCFMNVPRLEKLWIYNNKLTSLSMSIMSNSSSLKELGLYGDSWHCDESLCDVMSAIVSGRLGGTFFFPICATPPDLQGKRWSELKEHPLLRQCSPPSP